MTAFLNDGFQGHESADVSIWFCEGCSCFHIRAGRILLTFSREEFADFTHDVVEAHYGHKDNLHDDSAMPLITELAA